MERLSMRVHPYFLVAQFGVAHFAISIFSDDQVSLLQFVVLEFSVELLDLGEVVLDFAVFFIRQLVVENRGQEANQVAVIRL